MNQNPYQVTSALPPSSTVENANVAPEAQRARIGLTIVGLATGLMAIVSAVGMLMMVRELMAMLDVTLSLSADASFWPFLGIAFCCALASLVLGQAFCYRIPVGFLPRQWLHACLLCDVLLLGIVLTLFLSTVADWLDDLPMPLQFVIASFVYHLPIGSQLCFLLHLRRLDAQISSTTRSHARSAAITCLYLGLAALLLALLVQFFPWSTNVNWWEISQKLTASLLIVAPAMWTIAFVSYAVSVKQLLTKLNHPKNTTYQNQP
jgi:hypothetical protein